MRLLREQDGSECVEDRAVKCVGSPVEAPLRLEALQSEQGNAPLSAVWSEHAFSSHQIVPSHSLCLQLLSRLPRRPSSWHVRSVVQRTHDDHASRNRTSGRCIAWWGSTPFTRCTSCWTWRETWSTSASPISITFSVCPKSTCILYLVAEVVDA